jgi:hypothetical protein
MRIGSLCARATLPFLGFIHLVLLLLVAIRLNVPFLVTVAACELGVILCKKESQKEEKLMLL